MSGLGMSLVSEEPEPLTPVYLSQLPEAAAEVALDKLLEWLDGDATTKELRAAAEGLRGAIQRQREERRVGA